MCTHVRAAKTLIERTYVVRWESSRTYIHTVYRIGGRVRTKNGVLSTYRRNYVPNCLKLVGLYEVR